MSKLKVNNVVVIDPQDNAEDALFGYGQLGLVVAYIGKIGLYDQAYVVRSADNDFDDYVSDYIWNEDELIKLGVL